MSFQNSVIFPFPAVQYIPLAITKIMEGDLPKSPSTRQSAQLIAGPELNSWREILCRNYGVTIPKIFPALTFPVFAINLQVTTAKYRGFFVTLLGSKAQGHYQLFTIPAERFYKPKLFCQVFDPVSGIELARCSLFIPQTELWKPAAVNP